MTSLVTTATKKLLKLRKKIRAVSGGTGASKTYSIVMILIDYAQSVKGERVDIVSESYPHLEAGVMQDFKEIMKDRGYWKDDSWNKTAKTYTFETGTYIKFTSMDKIGKAHGPRRDVLFLNECNYMAFNIVDQLITRTRKTVWLDWNPSEDFWFYEEYLAHRKDLEFLGEGGTHPPLTYLDNEGLSQSEIDEILAHKHNKSWWRVYGQGLRGEIEGLIFPKWREVDEIPEGARLERRWLDFGYTNDESAIGEIWYADNTWFLNETLYRKGMSNKQLADHLISLPNSGAVVIADSSEPKSIAEIASYGLNITGVEKKVKGANPSKLGYVNWSIQLVQTQPIAVTKHSFNILKERRNYLWMVDKNGKILNEEDPSCKNHHMRGIAYALSTLGELREVTDYWDRIYAEELDSTIKVNSDNPAI